MASLAEIMALVGELPLAEQQKLLVILASRLREQVQLYPLRDDLATNRCEVGSRKTVQFPRNAEIRQIKATSHV